MTDEDRLVRFAASGSLNNLREFWTAELFLPALANANAHLRLKAASALGELNDARAVEPLIAFLSDEDARIRSNVIRLLGKLHDRRAVEPLIALLNDEDAEIRFQAYALGRLGDTRAVEPFIAVLSHKDATMRRKVVEALEMLGGTQAVEALITALNDSEPPYGASPAKPWAGCAIAGPGNRSSLSCTILCSGVCLLFLAQLPGRRTRGALGMVANMLPCAA